jgi:hypothetical protein
MEIDRTIHAALRHRSHDYRAEPRPLRWRHGRPRELGPAHREGIAVSPPADIHAAPIHRKRPVFPGVGGEFVEREPDGLCGNRLQAQLRAVHENARTNEIGEGGKLGANQVLDLDAMPFASDE